jgi:hypothetical protein
MLAGIPCIKKRNLLDYLSVNWPALVVDRLVDWPAASRWSPEVFSDLAPNARVALKISASAVFRSKPDWPLRALREKRTGISPLCAI